MSDIKDVFIDDVPRGKIPELFVKMNGKGYRLVAVFQSRCTKDLYRYKTESYDLFFSLAATPPTLPAAPKE